MIMPFTCTKRFSDIPFAHRQHKHDGHCAFIHGHNWSLIVTFACDELDHQGFVIDFGKLGFLKKWIAENLDHAFVYNADDPEMEQLFANYGSLFKPYCIDSCSAEGIALHIHEVFDKLVRSETADRVHISSVVVMEDDKNSAEYRPE